LFKFKKLYPSLRRVEAFAPLTPFFIIILDKEGGETKVSKVKDPEKLKEELAGNGILLSEWLLY
jgi:hypothetical protein